MSLFSEIEKTIERGFRSATERLFGQAESGDLVSLHHAMLESVEEQVQVLAHGRRVFPFPRVKVTLIAAEEARRNLLAAAFGEDRRLENDIREALEAAGCQIPRGFAIEIVTSASGDRPFFIDYERKPAKPAAETPVGRLVVVKGKAAHEEYVLDKPRTNIGRLSELTDSEQRVVRRNDVVFEENADEANGTVSRQHAHIRREDGQYRVADDGSEFGTRVFRDGRSIEVPAGNRRGERLRPGDEIYLGRACLRFEA
ncbi:MAG: FHA domain-containing protein [Bryobacteraceae bacterium]